ncbi:MAG: AI-2E family transporter [Thermomicrobiales bacterium]
MSKPRGRNGPTARPFLQFSPEESNEPTVRARLEIPPRTIATVAIGLLVIWVLIKLVSILLLVFLALLLTAALDPLVTRLERRGWKRSTAVSALLLAFVAIVLGTLALVIPPMVHQGQQLAADLPDYVVRAKPYFKGHPEAYARLQDLATRRAKDPDLYLSHARGVGLTVGSVLTQTLLIVTMTAYLLIADGERTLFWLFRYLPAQQRTRIRQALPEISRVVSAYMVGQLITSALFGAFALLVCAALGVPQSILLALLAFVADAIPIVGATIATAPAVLLALTVSPTKAAIVLVLYVVYQQVENHLIVPRVYKNTLQISSFGVLLAVAIGAQLLGIIGALIALPIAAALPVIERIWREEQPPAPEPSDIGLAPAPWEGAPAPSGTNERPPPTRATVDHSLTN